MLVLVVVFSFGALRLLDTLSHQSDLVNQVHVVCHDLKVVRLVNLALNFESLLEGRHRVLQELLLVLVLLLDVRLHIAVLRPLVLDERVQTLVQLALQLGVVIGVLHDLVYSVLEIVDVSLVVADCISVCGNCFGNQGLPHTEVLDHETERCVDGVVLIQLCIERAGPVFETQNLGLLWRDVLPEVANLFIEDELELFELLSLLLQVEDIFLPLMDDLVFDVNL